MNFVTVLGEPDSVASFINSLVNAGNYVDIVRLTKSNSAYIVGYSATGPVATQYLLMEDGSFLLLESGDRILLE